jgi:hypothetical protein
LISTFLLMIPNGVLKSGKSKDRQYTGQRKKRQLS